MPEGTGIGTLDTPCGPSMQSPAAQGTEVFMVSSPMKPPAVPSFRPAFAPSSVLGTLCVATTTGSQAISPSDVRTPRTAPVATVEPGASSGDKLLEHPGEELVYLLEGELEFTVAGKRFSLGRCDALHFRTVQPHSWRNPGRAPAVALWMALRPQ